MNCLESEVCTELPAEFFKEKCCKDSHGIIHLRVQDFMEDKSMKWMEMLGMIFMFKSRSSFEKDDSE